METKEPQYQIQAETFVKEGPVTMGLTTSHIWRSDPRHLLFFLSRYKFVSKMLIGYQNVLEVGCGDGFGGRLISQNGSHVTGVDFDETFLKEARTREAHDPLRTFITHDFTTGPMPKSYDAAYSLDVIEHIAPKDEQEFICNVASSIAQNGVCIFGTPSLESQPYASKWSKEGHINCKSALAWKQTFERYFLNVFIFSMNDEVLHTGYYPMSHYLFCLCVGPRKLADNDSGGR